MKPPAASQAPSERRALGEFLRLRRQRLAPEVAGLAATARRRTPGLRREELAALCAVSATWITWLEQGRAVSASAAVLARLAEALQLSAAERAYLFELAGRRDPAEPRADLPRAAGVSRSVAAMRCPAYVLDRGWNVAASNARADELFLGWGTAPLRERPRRSGRRPPEARPGPPNLLRFLFLHPPARKLIHDWPARSWRLVAEFRADCGRAADEPPLRALIDELAAASAEFALCWKSQEVQEREGGERLFHHPRLGSIAFEQITLRPATRADLKLVMLLPARKAGGKTKGQTKAPRPERWGFGAREGGGRTLGAIESYRV
jgi:transcriptional regulator with XRE-family HTH domain